MSKKGRTIRRTTELNFFGLNERASDKDIKHAYRRMKRELPHEEDAEELEQVKAVYRYLRRKKNRNKDEE
jgi:DnaJ-class molecular chaperone